MKIHPAGQHSVEWLEARAGIPTASEFSALVTDKLELRKWSTEMPNTYLAKKLAERWCGPLPGAGKVFATDQGEMLEGEAKPWYEFEFGEEITSVGLCTTDDGRIGCSPDGLLGEEGGVEIKCPETPTHVKYLLAGEVPTEYLAQVHGSMLVTGRPWWKFVSYRRRMPALVKLVERDEHIQEILDVALTEFLKRLDDGWERLVEMNGGPPPKREPMVFAHEMARTPEEEEMGVTP